MECPFCDFLLEGLMKEDVVEHIVIVVDKNGAFMTHAPIHPQIIALLEQAKRQMLEVLFPTQPKKPNLISFPGGGSRA